MSPVISAEDASAYLAAERVTVDAALERACADIERQAPPPLAAPIRYALEARGKRLRPVLCIAAYRALYPGLVSDAVYDVAVAIELVHTYSLVHDDLPCMDDDDLRRGRPTTHRAFGDGRAMLAGAALIPHACALLVTAGVRAGLAPAEGATLVGELTRAAGANGMVGGQLEDLEAERHPIPLSRLEGIHGRKTGKLFEASLRMGGLVARADARTVRALGNAGRALGLAFQITDDLLDETGYSAVLGKSAGRDRERSKATFPALLGVDGAQRHAQECAREAAAALTYAGIDDPLLHALVRFAVERNR